MWKSVQHAHFVSTTSSSPTSSAERYYKNNAVSSASLWVLETHLLRSLRLQSTAPHAFAAAVQHAAARGRQFDSAHVASDPAAQYAVDDLRLWYWALVADVHGALTTGRALHFSSGETALALRTVRALAGFNLQASDVRLAALVELYEVVREAMRSEWAFTGDSVGAAGPSSCRWKPEWEGEMDEFNRRIDAWEDDWVGRLKAAFVGSETGKEGDKIAWSALGNKHLCKTILNASCVLSVFSPFSLSFTSLGLTPRRPAASSTAGPALAASPSMIHPRRLSQATRRRRPPRRRTTAPSWRRTCRRPSGASSRRPSTPSSASFSTSRSRAASSCPAGLTTAPARSSGQLQMSRPACARRSRSIRPSPRRPRRRTIPSAVSCVDSFSLSLFASRQERD